MARSVRVLTGSGSAALSLARNLDLNETGMVLMEVGLLSGFSARLDLVPLDGAVKRVETEPGRAVLYLDSVS